MGYGLVMMHSWGFRSKAWLHPGAMGEMMWLARGRDAALFSTSFPRRPIPDREVRILEAFESQNYPEETLCPYPSIKLPGELPLRPLPNVPWELPAPSPGL